MALSKKKLTQDELRRLMNEQKKKLLYNVKKIESPLARYDKDGILHCVICETVVRSETVWSVHINSKNHKQNIISKVKKKEELLKPQKIVNISKLKRPVSLPSPVPSKKIKGILKNSSTTISKEKPNDSTLHPTKVKLVDESDSDTNSDEDEQSVNEKNKTESEITNQDSLPEGFFDDPKLDAKIRNVEYKDPVEEEWEQFQKEIKEETSKAQQIIAEDQEEATAERQIDEIDEQIRNWSRVVNLEKKKQKVNTTITGQMPNKNDEENLEEEFEEFLDWRSKKSFEFKNK